MQFGRCPTELNRIKEVRISAGQFRLFRVFYVFCGHEFSKGTNSLKTECELSCIALSHRNGNRSSFLQPRECVSTSALSGSSMKAFHSSPRILVYFFWGMLF